MSEQLKGQLSRADLLEALVTADNSVIEYLSRQLGLTILTEHSIEALVNTLGKPSPPNLKKDTSQSNLPDTVIKPFSGYWSLERREETRQQDWMKEIANQEPLVWPPHSAELPVHYPLSSPHSLLARLFHHLKRQHDSREIDIDIVVKKLSSGENLISFPKTRHRSLGYHLHLIDDRQLHLTPYWRDHSLYANLIENLLPDYATSRALLQNGHSLPISFINYDELADWVLPPEGSVVLVFSDLGALATNPGSLVEIWLNLAQTLTKQGCKLIALVPCHPNECNVRLKSLFIIEPWEIGQHLKPCTKLQRQAQAEQLLTLLAPAIRLEPSLLRSVRTSIARHGISMNAAVEAVVWQHPAMQEHSSVAATFSIEARQQWLNQFYAEDSSLRKMILTIIRIWRTRLQQHVWFEEITSLDEASRLLVPQQDIQAAEQYFQQLIHRSNSGYLLTEDVDTQLWLRRLEKRLQPSACNLLWMGSVLQEIIVQLHKDEVCHINHPIDPALLAPVNAPEQTACLYKRDKSVVIAPSKITDAEVREHNWLTTIRYKRPLLYIKFEAQTAQTFLFQKDLHTSLVVCDLPDTETLMIRSDLDSLYFRFTPIMDRSVTLFYSYSHNDEALRNKFEIHLKLLQRQKVIDGWYDRKIGEGSEWKDTIDSNLETADIILLLISADFLASDYCFDIEVYRAMERHEEKSAVVIPVLLRPCDSNGAEFMKLQGLPEDFKPIIEWQYEDEAFVDIFKSIREVAEGFRNKKLKTQKIQAHANEWLRDLLEIHETADDSLEFNDNLKVDLHPQEIFVFTPKGGIIKLPRGATIIDFAYAVHTDIGNACISARIDKKIVPLKTKLENGMLVEIITAPWARPNALWLNYVTTVKARSSIRNHLKNFKQQEAISLGRRLLEKELQTLHMQLKDIGETRIQALLKVMAMSSMNELLEDIGLGNKMPFLIAKRLTQDNVNANIKLNDTDKIQKTPLIIKGTEGMVITLSKCCRPIPGDSIIGYFNPGKGIVVHHHECRNRLVLRKKHANWLDVEWSPDATGDFPTELRLEILNQRGALATIASTITEMGSNIEHVTVVIRMIVFVST